MVHDSVRIPELGNGETRRPPDNRGTRRIPLALLAPEREFENGTFDPTTSRT